MQSLFLVYNPCGIRSNALGSVSKVNARMSSPNKVPQALFPTVLGDSIFGTTETSSAPLKKYFTVTLTLKGAPDCDTTKTEKLDCDGGPFSTATTRMQKV